MMLKKATKQLEECILSSIYYIARSAQCQDSPSTSQRSWARGNPKDPRNPIGASPGIPSAPLLEPYWQSTDPQRRTAI